MLTFLVALLAGSALGFLAGIGVGGGSLLILWLTAVLKIPQPEARILNLLFFLPSAAIASVFRHREGNLNIRKVLPAILAGCVAAGLFSLLSRTLDTQLLKKLFGCLLLITGVREILYRPRKAR